MPPSFNPLSPGEDDPARRVIDNVFDTLLVVNAGDAALEPGLASAWSVTTDTLTVTFSLRADAVWHDGEPFTAADVLFTFDAVEAPRVDTPLKSNLAQVRGYLAPDSHTVIVSLSRPDCSVLYDLAQIPILPRHLFESGELTTDALELDVPIGTGPFRFGTRLPGGGVRLERNETYFAGVPAFRSWTYRPITDTAELIHSLQAEEVDLAPVYPQQAASFPQDGPVRLLSYPQPEYFALILNHSAPYLEDPRVRQALAHAIDRPRLVQELLGGAGRVIDMPWLDQHWACDASPTVYAYDPQRAERLLREAGWSDTDGDGLLDRDGAPLHIGISVNGENALRSRIALAVQRYWIAVGISAELRYVEFPVLVENLFTHRFDAAAFSWPIHADPDQAHLWMSAKNGPRPNFNFAAYEDERLDEALLAGLTAAGCDSDLRTQAYSQAASIIARELPYIFLFVSDDFVAVNTRLEGVQPGPYAGLGWNIHRWRPRGDKG